MLKRKLAATNLFVLIIGWMSFSPVLGQDISLRELRAVLQPDTAETETGSKCGFSLMLDAAVSKDPVVNQLYNRYLLTSKQTTLETYLSPSGHFLIHYQTSGFDSIPSYDRDQNGLADYLEFVAKSFDRAWEIEIDSLGFNPPPGADGQPLTTYPVYCQSLGYELYGSTVPEILLPGPPGVNRFTSRIELNTNFSFIDSSLYAHVNPTNDPMIRDSLAIAVTAAHEFNHACQLDYQFWIDQNNNFTDRWFIENSATYMEEVVAEEVNDYILYLGGNYGFFNNTHKRIATSSNELRIYGQVVLNIMLGDLYGKTITREVWEEIRNRRAVEAIDVVLRQKNSDFEAELRRLGAWILFSGPNRAIPGKFFTEAAGYPFPATTVQNIQDQSQVTVNGSLPSLAFRYYEVPISSPGDLTLMIAPESNAEAWGGTHTTQTEPYIYNFPANDTTVVPLLGSEPSFYLMVFRGGGEGSGATVDYGLRLSLNLKSNPNEVGVYPVVIRPEEEVSNVTFLNLPEEAKIEIFTSNGQHLSTVRPANLSRVAYWNLRTSQGNPVGSGVYIYRVVSPARNQTGKIMVIR